MRIGPGDELGWASYADSPIHRLAAEAKIAATLAFIVVVVSFPKHALAPLVPFLFYPILLVVLGEVPLRPLARRLLLAAPFAVMIGVFNPWLDRAPAASVLGVPVAAGWLSFASIVLRFGLTVSAALALAATTPFPEIAQALGRMKVPRAMVVQLLFLHRYLEVLVQEAGRMSRARALRSRGRRGKGIRVTASLISQLLLRSLDRAERIYQAMRVRGFRGEIHVLGRRGFGPADALFVAAVAGASVAMRLLPVVRWIGDSAGRWL